MNITTITLIVAGVAIALGIQAILLHILGMRKIGASLKDIMKKIEEERTAPMQLLVNKYAPNGDFEEEDDEGDDAQPAAATTTTQFVETPAPDKAKAGEPSEPSGKPTPNEAALQMAYSVFTTQYKNLCQGLDVHNYKERAPQMARLLIEMGVWLKDFLPVSQGDFNTTNNQKDNVKSIGQPDDERKQRLAAAPVPTGNTNNTPMEVIALNHILQEWGVDDLQLLISGYQYKKDKEAKK